jgi:uncharacterized protein (DUF2141 family)
MKMNGFILSLLMIIPFCANGQSSGNIIVHIENINREEGTLRVGLFTEKDKFLKEASYSQDIPVEGRKKISLSFENIPYGTYAISVFQDLDNNGELDTNFIGIPREPVGFSNDHMPKMSPPKFKAAGFVLDQPSYTETIGMYSY